MVKKKLRLISKTLDEKMTAVEAENMKKLDDMRAKRTRFISNGGQMGLFQLHKKPLPEKNSPKLV